MNMSHQITKLKAVYDIAIIVTSSDFIDMTHLEMSQQFDQLFDQAGIVSKNKTVKTAPKNP
jgi:regulation of enolase protein 1 (concanavalin A-like superfamily)